jgi:hypothetical protein
MLRQFVFVLLAIFLSLNAGAQVDFSRFEYDWCKPIPGYKTQFAISNYEKAAAIPVTFNQSAEVPGYKTFFNIALANTNENVTTPDSLFEYYNRCFAGAVDTVFFRGPTLYCLRLFKKQTYLYVSIQYANEGKSYYVNVIEAERKPDQQITSDQIAMELAHNKRSQRHHAPGTGSTPAARNRQVHPHPPQPQNQHRSSHRRRRRPLGTHQYVTRKSRFRL